MRTRVDLMQLRREHALLRPFLAITCALVVGPTAAGAVECGQVLTEDTVLEADLTCSGDGLVVGADGIVIDLGGHLLHGGLFAPGSAGIRNHGHRDVEIRNGGIDSFDQGVELVGVSGNRIEALGLSDDTNAGIVLIESHENHVYGNHIASYYQRIVLIDSDRNRVEGNRTRGDSGEAISLSSSNYNELIDNVAHSGDDAIVLRHSDHNLLEGNNANAYYSTGIVLRDSHENRLFANSAGNSEVGIILGNSHRNLIAGNRLGGEVGALSIGGSHFNRIEANYIGGVRNGEDMVRLGTSDHNQITGNVVVGNYRVGLPSFENVGIRLFSGVGNRLAGNAVTNHWGDAILVEGTASETQLLRNLVAENGDDGLDVEDPTAQIVGNTASGNGDYGIEAVPGVKGGANRASDNGNPEQCLEIACK